MVLEHVQAGTSGRGAGKRVLLIAYHYPPEASAGAQRMGFIARYLKDAGYEVSVVSPPPRRTQEGATAARAVSPLEARLRRFAGSVVHFPDRAVGWVPHAVSAALRETAKAHFDIVITSAMPASVHLTGWIVAHARGLPWIADYRDLWTGNPYLEDGPLRRALGATLERLLLGRANAITTVSTPIAHSLAVLHRREHVDVIANAVEPAEWEDVPFVTPDRFRIVHTGTLYEGKRKPDLLFGALAHLRTQGHPLADEVCVDFYGHDNGAIDAIAREHGVADLVAYRGSIPRESALREQRSAALLLILLNMDPATAGEYGSKLFEYAGARRPILAIGPQASVVRSYLEAHRMGAFASDEEQTRLALIAAYDRYRAGEAALRLAFDPTAFFTARDLALRFQDVIDRIVQPRGFFH